MSSLVARSARYAPGSLGVRRISADEAAVLHDPEFIAMIKQRVVDMQNGAGDILTQEEIRAQLAALDDVDDD